MIYLIHGDNYYESALELKKLLSEVGKKEDDIEFTTKHGDEVQSLNDIFSESDAFSFFSSKKFLVVKRLFSNRKTSILSEVSDYLSDKKNSDIIFWEDKPADKRSRLYKLINKVGVVREFENRKFVSLKSWLMNLAKNMGLHLSPERADELLFRVGTNEAVLDSELNKLTAFLSSESRSVVETADLEILSERWEASIWDFVDAMTERDYKKALFSLEVLVREREDYLQVLGMIARQIRIIAQIVYTNGDVTKKMNLHPFVISKIKKHLNYFTEEKIKQMYSRLTNLDLSVKSGKIDEKLGLTLYVLAV